MLLEVYVGKVCDYSLKKGASKLERGKNWSSHWVTAISVWSVVRLCVASYKLQKCHNVGWWCDYEIAHLVLQLQNVKTKSIFFGILSSL